MTTVWVIEQGQYSDYRVVGIFTTREYAQRVADAINASDDEWDKATVDEWPLDPKVAEMNSGMTPWHVTMNREGVSAIKPQRPSSYVFTDHEVFSFGTRLVTMGRYSEQFAGQQCLNGSLWAKDAEHAAKIANEKRAELIANGEWQ